MSWLWNVLFTNEQTNKFTGSWKKNMCLNLKMNMSLTDVFKLQYRSDSNHTTHHTQLQDCNDLVIALVVNFPLFSIDSHSRQWHIGSATSHGWRVGGWCCLLSTWDGKPPCSTACLHIVPASTTEPNTCGEYLYLINELQLTWTDPASFLYSPGSGVHVPALKHKLQFFGRFPKWPTWTHWLLML